MLLYTYRLLSLRHITSVACHICTFNNAERQTTHSHIKKAFAVALIFTVQHCYTNCFQYGVEKGNGNKYCLVESLRMMPPVHHFCFNCTVVILSEAEQFPKLKVAANSFAKACRSHLHITAPSRLSATYSQPSDCRKLALLWNTDQYAHDFHVILSLCAISMPCWAALRHTFVYFRFRCTLTILRKSQSVYRVLY